ncbi:MAG: ABC transporter substrate-binding protein [Actinomycetota bacterium]
MRRAGRIDRRLAVVAVLTLVGTACTIRAPRIVLQGQGGSGAGVDGVPLSNPTAQSSGFGGAQFGGQQLGGGTKNPEQCKGKSTDVGITGSTIKLGSTFAISGPVSNISGPILKGVQAYINKVNAEDGVNGRLIDFKYYDDGWDAQRGKAKIKQLVEQDKVFMLISVPSSNGLDAASSYLDAKRVPVIGTSGLIETQFRSHMQWPIGTSTRSSTRIGLLDVTQRLHAKTIALVWLDLLAGYEAKDAMEKALARGFAGLNSRSLVATRRISISEPTFESVWNDIQRQARDNGVADGRPDYIFLAIDPTNAIKAMQAAQRLGYRPKLGWGGAAPLFLDLVLKDAPYAVETGLIAGTGFFPPIAEFAGMAPVQEFTRTVQKYYADVDVANPYLQGGYAGAALAIDLLKNIGPCLDRASVIAAANSLSNYSAAGLTKPLTYRPLRTGPQHYGNTYGLVVQATRQGQHGCTRAIGCWRWIRSPRPDGWYQDPEPGT